MPGSRPESQEISMEILVKLLLSFSIIVFNMMKLLDKTFTIKLFTQIEGGTKLYPQIIFVSTTKLGGNTINILNCYFSK